MRNLDAILSPMIHELQQAIQEACNALFASELTVDLTRPEEQFGDYATNIALQLAKQLGKNPREIAETLAVKIRENLADTVREVAVAGPGFLNITLNDSALLTSMSAKPNQSLAGKTIVAEYSDPNPFKPLHAGHLYTTLMGDVIARMLETGGASVVRISYGGDVGLHVGKSMWAIVRNLGGENPDKLADIPAENRAAWLGERYVEGNTAYEDDEASKQEIITANKRVYQVHSENDHESPFARIYWTCRDWSYEYFKTLYDQLAVHQFDRTIPESEIVPLGLKTVREQLQHGVYEESDGAIIFRGEEYGLHTRVFINSQGLPTYEAKDVGLLLTKWQDYHFDRSIVITANEQAEYMTVMLKSVEQFAPEPATRSQHLTHGMVKLKGGVKMSSRKGNTVGAIDIIDAATLANRTATGGDNPDTVLGAIKYAFLKNRIGGDIIYIPEESVSLEGNSGPYLQYAHARACSILRKAGEATDQGDNITLDLEAISRQARDDGGLGAGERSLVRKISEYTEVVDKAVQELMPHYICTYLYELAQTFNRFYEHNRVIGDERQTLRLTLVKQYADTLKTGLGLLGIASPDKM